MYLANGLPKRDDALPERLATARKRRRVQPLTWIVTAALMPVLLYDVWQTVHDVKQRHVARAYVALNMDSRAVARPQFPQD